MRRKLIILLWIFGLIVLTLFLYAYIKKISISDVLVFQNFTPTKDKIVDSLSAVQTAGKDAVSSLLTPVSTNGSLVPEKQVEQNGVTAPGPLRVTSNTKSSALSVAGIISQTNKERAVNGALSALTENSFLDRDAELKLNDMFNKQYFEHVSPSGVGPSDLAQQVGYAYVIVGENLALGNFEGDEGVVTAWMNSPGHRANILNPYFQEIGIAVGKGPYEGSEVWLAVQSFGMPISACPAVNTNLQIKIEENNVTIASLKSQLDVKKAQLDATSTSDPRYNMYVEEFNALVPQYNNLVETNRFNVATYNGSVKAFNACVEVAGGSSTVH